MVLARTGGENKPVIDPDTWPNSGIGRLNPDGSRGTCHACHSRHAFEAKLSRSPENCGKCHMGPDHPQIEIYNESKHGIAFHANRPAASLFHTCHYDRREQVTQIYFGGISCRIRENRTPNTPISRGIESFLFGGAFFIFVFDRLDESSRIGRRTDAAA